MSDPLDFSWMPYKSIDKIIIWADQDYTVLGSGKLLDKLACDDQVGWLFEVRGKFGWVMG